MRVGASPHHPLMFKMNSPFLTTIYREPNFGHLISQIRTKFCRRSGNRDPIYDACFNPFLLSWIPDICFNALTSPSSSFTPNTTSIPMVQGLLFYLYLTISPFPLFCFNSPNYFICSTYRSTPPHLFSPCHPESVRL